MARSARPMEAEDQAAADDGYRMSSFTEFWTEKVMHLLIWARANPLAANTILFVVIASAILPLLIKWK